MKYNTTNIVGVLLQVSSNPSYRHNVHQQHMALSDLEYIFQFTVVRKSKCEQSMVGEGDQEFCFKSTFLLQITVHMLMHPGFFFLRLMCLYSSVDSDLSVDSFVQKLQDFSVRNSFACLFIHCQTVVYTKAELSSVQRTLAHGVIDL